MAGRVRSSAPRTTGTRMTLGRGRITIDKEEVAQLLGALKFGCDRALFSKASRSESQQRRQTTRDPAQLSRLLPALSEQDAKRFSTSDVVSESQEWFENTPSVQYLSLTLEEGLAC